MVNKIAAFAQVDVVPQWYLFIWRTLQLGSWMPGQEYHSQQPQRLRHPIIHSRWVLKVLAFLDI
jgi:hypothetical protein